MTSTRKEELHFVRARWRGKRVLPPMAIAALPPQRRRKHWLATALPLLLIWMSQGIFAITGQPSVQTAMGDFWEPIHVKSIDLYWAEIRSTQASLENRMMACEAIQPALSFFEHREQSASPGAIPGRARVEDLCAELADRQR